MLFVSSRFIFFLAVSVALYYLLPRRMQWMVLLAASGVFYLAGGWQGALYLLLTTASTYAAGRLLGRLNARAKEDRALAARTLRQKKALVLAVLLLNFGILFTLKYLAFALSAAASALSLVGISLTATVPDLLMPLGISFFIFQSVGYVVDTYRGTSLPERNFLKFALFTSFFPQMVQGPISRYGELSAELSAEHPFDTDALRRGIQRMLGGYIKKMVIADRAAVLVKTFFGDYDAYGGAIGALAIGFYCIELYCDFSGGIDITVGAAELFGIRLKENFARPLLATSLADYWRRWHITLGEWMRDYVFYPLSFSKPLIRLGKWSRRRLGGRAGKILPVSVATFTVYLFIGIWHAASFRYIFYGMYNGAIITASLLLTNVYASCRNKLGIRQNSFGWRLFSIVRTAGIVFIGRYFTRSPRLLVGFSLILRAVTPGQMHLSELYNGTVLNMGLTALDLGVVGVCFAALLLIEIWQEKHGSLRDALARKSGFVQWLALAIPLFVLVVFGIYRGSYISSEFIYQQY